MTITTGITSGLIASIYPTDQQTSASANTTEAALPETVWSAQFIRGLYNSIFSTSSLTACSPAIQSPPVIEPRHLTADQNRMVLNESDMQAILTFLDQDASFLLDLNSEARSDDRAVFWQAVADHLVYVTFNNLIPDSFTRNQRELTVEELHDNFFYGAHLIEAGASGYPETAGVYLIHSNEDQIPTSVEMTIPLTEALFRELVTSVEAEYQDHPFYTAIERYGRCLINRSFNMFQRDQEQLEIVFDGESPISFLLSWCQDDLSPELRELVNPSPEPVFAYTPESYPVFQVGRGRRRRAVSQVTAGFRTPLSIEIQGRLLNLSEDQSPSDVLIRLMVYSGNSLDEELTARLSPVLHEQAGPGSDEVRLRSSLDLRCFATARNLSRSLRLFLRTAQAEQPLIEIARLEDAIRIRRGGARAARSRQCREEGVRRQRAEQERHQREERESPLANLPDCVEFPAAMQPAMRAASRCR